MSDRTISRDLLAAAAAAAALVLVAALVPWLRFVLTVALAKGLAALGLMLLLRAGQVSFGHGLFVAASAYSVAFLAPRVPEMLLLLPLSLLVAGLLGLAVGAFVVRYRDIFFGMLNLALSMVFYSLLDKFYDVTRGSDGLRVPPTALFGQALSGEARGWAVFGFALALALAFAALCRVYLGSPMGQALAGIKTREDRLAFMGVPSRLVLLFAYAASAVMAGAGGFVTALATGQVTPALAYWTSSGELIFITILGGTGSVFGPFLGALAYELTRVYAAATLAGAWQMVLGGMMLVVILFAPGGLLQIASLRPRRKISA